MKHADDTRTAKPVDYDDISILTFGYLSALPTRFRWDIQVPRRLWKKWADTHKELTGVRILQRDASQIAGLYISESEDKRAAQNRFQYFPAGHPPKDLWSKSREHTQYARVSNKDFSQQLRRFGKGPSKAGMMDWDAGYQHLTPSQKSLFDAGKAMASLPSDVKVTEKPFIKQFSVANDRISKLLARPFKMKGETAEKLTSTVRIARDASFRQVVLDSYGGQCALCGSSFRFKNHLETEAAHIVPKSARGTDDPRNGLALCRSHHWAFDTGMWAVKPNGRIVVSKVALELPENAELAQYRGKRLKRGKINPEPKALAYRLDKIFHT
ncbi:MAG: HNH endonuclease [Gammaproteobacteria bacterium]|nr:HNH endonuclease [Gammaproteobacteria bacterium]